MEATQAVEAEQRSASARYALEHAADAAAACRQRDAADLAEAVDAAVRIGETAAHEVWLLREVLPPEDVARSLAYDAYGAACDGIGALKAAAAEADGSEERFRAAWNHFQRALRILGW